MAEFKKGMRVYLRDGSSGYYNVGDGGVDTEHSYIIRSIGKKQAVLAPEPREGTPSYRRGGSTYYLSSPGQIRRYTNEGREVPSYMKTEWLQIFVPIGNDGWDAEENY